MTIKRKRESSLYLGLALIFLFTLFLSLPFTARAFTIEKLNGVEVRNDFVLGPGKTELSMDPGESQSREMIVTNRTGHDVTFKIEVEDFVGSRDPSRPTILLGKEKGPYSLKDYLNIERKEFVLKQGERARIPVVVKIPADAEPGGRYGTVLVSAQPSNNKLKSEAGVARGGAKIITRLGTLFFVRVNGNLVEDGSLKSFRTRDRKIFSGGPIPFDLLFENRGNVHLDPYGTIEITNIFGRQVGKIEIDPWFAMPNSLRFREVHWDKTFLVGRYKAHAEIHRGYGDKIDKADIVFWVIPWRTIVTGLIILFLIVLFGRWLFSKFEIRRKL